MLPHIIAIEGIDGAGKATQAALLASAASTFGQQATVFSFPDYTTPTGKLIAAYLRGEVKGDPRMVAALYSLNRLEKKAEIEAILECSIDPHQVIIFDRYAYSNTHHVAHFVDNGIGGREEIEAFINHVEWEVCGAFSVAPKANILLDIPDAGAAQLQVASKSARSYDGGEGAVKADIHEGDAAHLSSTNTIYRDIARRDGWTVINCIEGGVMRSPTSISNEIVASLLLR